MWPLTFGLACCAIEMISAACSQVMISIRFGTVFRSTPRQADVMVVAGTMSKKMAPAVKLLFTIRWPSLAGLSRMGGCASVGRVRIIPTRLFRALDLVVPVDVYVPGCPPRPEALLYSLSYSYKTR